MKGNFKVKCINNYYCPLSNELMWKEGNIYSFVNGKCKREDGVSYGYDSFAELLQLNRSYREVLVEVKDSDRDYIEKVRRLYAMIDKWEVRLNDSRKATCGFLNDMEAGRTFGREDELERCIDELKGVLNKSVRV